MRDRGRRSARGCSDRLRRGATRRIARRRAWNLPGAALLGLLAVTGAAAAAADASPAVRPIVDRTVLEIDRPRVVPMRCDHADPASLEVSIDPPGRCEVLFGPAPMKGSSPGKRLVIVRLVGRSPGRATLTVGDGSMTLEVVPDRTGPPAAPRIAAPVSRARAWGTIAVRVETPVVSDAAGRGELDVSLELPGGHRLEPAEVLVAADAGEAHVQHRFELDLEPFMAGPLELRPIARRSNGPEVAGRPIVLEVIHPAEDQCLVAEAELPCPVERPERFADDRRSIGHDRAASGGAFHVNNGQQPAVCLPLRVEADGWYQMIIRAAGSRAGGAWPTVAVVVDGENQARTASPIAGDTWHRVPVGRPVRLEAGRPIITPLFANDFHVPMRCDRNLLLDRVELVRLSPGEGDGTDEGTGNTMGGMAMGGAMMGMAGGMMAGDDGAVGPAGVLVGLERVLEGVVAPGPIVIEARCWWPDPTGSPPPVVELLVDGVVIDRQRSGGPRFLLDPRHLPPGGGRVELVARADDGSVDRVAPQFVRCPPAVHADDAPVPHHRRFSIHEPRWSDDVAGRLREGHWPRERRTAFFASNGSAVLELPDELAGTFQVDLEARGDVFEGMPVARVELETGHPDDPSAERVEIGSPAVGGWWHDVGAGPAELPAGPKRLVVSFVNDRHEPGVGDRNLWLQALNLRERTGDDDRVAPSCVLVHPSPGERIRGADMVVVEAADARGVDAIQVFIDGRETPLTAHPGRDDGRQVIPIPGRHLEPGPHRIAVAARDHAGNVTRTADVEVLVVGADDPEPTRFERAVLLLDRFGAGPDRRSLASALEHGPDAWLEASLRAPADTPGERAARGAVAPHFAELNAWSVPRRVGGHLLHTPNPTRARLVLELQNHFSTWIRKAGARHAWEEHLAFARLGATTFDRWLLASASSPAMLSYLDQSTSFVGRLNENYARELLELHTLGVEGGYEQADVTALAELLTGWTASAEGDGGGGNADALAGHHRYDPALAVEGPIDVLGLELPAAAAADRRDRVLLVLEALAAHPSTARFVAGKLVRIFAESPPPGPLVDAVATVFMEEGGDLATCLLEMAGHLAFLEAARRPRPARPIDYALRTLRCAEHAQPWLLADFLDRCGQGLFDRAMPDGYPVDDPSATDTNRTAQRWRLASEARWPLVQLVPGGLRWSGELDDPRWQDAAIDTIAIRLTGAPLGERSHAIVRDALAELEGNRGERLSVLAPLVAQMPEAATR